MRPLLFLALLFLSTASFSQSERKVLNNAEKMMKKQQYLSAFEYLDKKNSDNSSVRIVLKKVELALHYHITTDRYHFFSFADLQEEETLEEAREDPEKTTLYAYDIPTVMEDLIRKHPENIELYEAAGDFYFSAFAGDPQEWLSIEPDILSRIRDYYQLALTRNVVNDRHLYRIGYIFLVERNYSQAIDFLQQSLELNRDNAVTHYNLAYAYISNGEPDKAQTHAAKAAALATSEEVKADVARMQALIFLDKKEYSSAIRYINESNDLDPHNYYTLRMKLNIEASLKHLEKAAATIEEFYRLDPENPTVYNDLVEIYLDNELEQELITFFTHKLQNKKGDPKIAGNIYFYLGYIYNSKRNNTLAKKNFTAAREQFEKVYSIDNQIFKVIDAHLISVH